jgi:hypothetical protein
MVRVISERRIAIRTILIYFCRFRRYIFEYDKSRKKAVQERITGNKADLNYTQATNQELEEVSETLSKYGMDISLDVQEIVKLKQARDSLALTISDLNHEIEFLNEQKRIVIEKVNQLRTMDKSQAYLDNKRVTIDSIQKEQLIVSLKQQISNYDQQVKLRHDEMQKKRIQLTQTIAKIETKETSIKIQLEGLNMRM